MSNTTKNDGSSTADVFRSEPSQKKRKADGKKKGNLCELQLVNVRTQRFGGGFFRPVGSGNRWGQVSHLSKHAYVVVSGDLIVPQRFRWAVGSKGGHEGIDLNSVFVGGNVELDGFLEQVGKDAARCGRKPMLCWKRGRKPWVAFVPTTELAGRAFQFVMRYGEWSGVALDELLKLPNDFFLADDFHGEGAK